MTQPTKNSHSITTETVTGQSDTYSIEQLNIDGELKITDYVQSVPISGKAAEDVRRWATKRREKTRTALASRLTTWFGCTLTASLVLIGAAAFSPDADKELIKDLIPQVVNPQVTLLGVALTFYFTSKEDE